MVEGSQHFVGGKTKPCEIALRNTSGGSLSSDGQESCSTALTELILTAMIRAYATAKNAIWRYIKSFSDAFSTGWSSCDSLASASRDASPAREFSNSGFLSSVDPGSAGLKTKITVYTIDMIMLIANDIKTITERMFSKTGKTRSSN